MQAHIVHCHPEPASFNTALTRAAKDVFETRGDQIDISDLYTEGFDPVEKAVHYRCRQDPNAFSALAEQRHAFETGTLPGEIQREIARLERAELLILQFPIWWHPIPAMLKGWMDRVFLSGGLYTSKMRYDRGYFRGRRAICSATTGAPASSFEPGGRGGEVNQILWSTHYSLHYMGFDVLPPFVAFGVQGHGFSYVEEDDFARQMSQTITEWRRRLERIDSDAPLSFPGWEDWDEAGRLRAVGVLSANHSS